jgi:signal transduction histidine kinase
MAGKPQRSRLCRMHPMNDPKEQISARLSRAKAELDAALVEVERLPVFEAGTVIFSAHALNNFLTVTSATIELLQLHLGNVANPDVPRLLDGLRHTTDLMTNSVARLMSSSAREARLVSDAADLVRLTHSARDYYQRLASRKQIEIIAESTAPSAPLRSDSVAIGAVLDNLVTNAIKYSPPGKRIWLSVTVEPDAVCSVQDEGPGLSPEDQARLFQKGVRLSAVPPGGESSTGYGLAVAKELITGLGGTIWCDSILGQGACFSFRLPVARPAEGSTPGTTAS